MDRPGMSHRASLFAEARRGGYGGGGGSSQLEVVVDPLHASSAIDTEITSLREKVSRLKKVANCIGDEAREQKTLLQQLEDTMTDARSAVRTTLKKIDLSLSRGGSSKYLFQVILFAFAFFFLLYVWKRFG